MRFFRRGTSLTCRRAVALVSDYLDGALPADQRRELELHLARCSNCSEYLRQIRATIQAIGHVDSDELDPAIRRDLIELYRNTIRTSD